MSEALITKYRPQTFDEVVGHDAQKRMLQSAIKRRSSQAFLLSGPSGTGKTTLARIGAAELGCQPRDVEEIDAATYTGIDSMRKLQETLRYRPLAGEYKAIIVDECARLSAQAWESCLKIIEEPPPFLSWWFCTTDLHKVPKAIMTRCLHVKLGVVSNETIAKLVERIAKLERSVMSDGVKQVCTREAQGSPRQALVNIAACLDIKDAQTAREALRAASEVDAIPALCQLILKRGSMLKAIELIAKLETNDLESHRLACCRYLSGIMRNIKSDNSAIDLLDALEAFSIPYNAGEGLAPLYLSVGRVLYKQ